MIAYLSVALAGTCAPTTLTELAATPGPAVFVLGERKGTQPDLSRAARLVARLRVNGPVTVALQAVTPDKQPVLDRFAAGEVEALDLPGLLDWTNAWGFPWGAYAPLVTGALHGDDVVGIGVPFQAKPEDVPVPLAPGYGGLLTDSMSGHPMPPALESVFVQSVAWMDHRLARDALSAWKGEGALVIVVDRLHVEGGRGVAWQAQRLTEVPVHAVLLGGPGGCYDGDRHLAP